MEYPLYTQREFDRLIVQAMADDLDEVVAKRLSWFAYAAAQDWNIDRTCRYFGISRSTFLRWIGRFDENDLTTLSDRSRRPHSVRMPETDPKVVALIGEIRKQWPLLGKQKVCELLEREYGIDIAPATVGRIIHRSGFFFANTESHRQKRLRAPTASGGAADADDDAFFLMPLTGLTS
jgi:transposase